MTRANIISAGTELGRNLLIQKVAMATRQRMRSFGNFKIDTTRVRRSNEGEAEVFLCVSASELICNLINSLDRTVPADQKRDVEPNDGPSFHTEKREREIGGRVR
jgi:hypothetical protein